MRHVGLGRTGLQVSRLCLGTMTFGLQCDEPASVAILDRAAAGGIAFLDAADVYPLGGSLETVGRTEEILGRWLEGRRHDFVVATKCSGAMSSKPWDRGASRKHILDAIEGSLRRLRTHYVDLYQIHHTDPQTPMDETLRALDDVVRAGKARYVGCSNYHAYQVARPLGRSEPLGLARFDSVQPRYNLLFRQIEAELLPLALDQGIGVISYNPLAGGLLTGRYQPGQAPEEGSRFTVQNAGKLYQARYWQEPQMQAVEELKAFCQEHHIDIAQLAIAWVLAQPAITSAIVGASKPEHLDQTLHAVDLVLDEQMRANCDDIWYRLPRERNSDIAFR